MLQIAYDDIDRGVKRMLRMSDSDERSRLIKMLTAMTHIYDEMKTEPNRPTQFESFIEVYLYEALSVITSQSKETPIRIKPQYVVGGFRLDIAFPDYKLAIECDGQEYHSSNEARFRDTERDQVLRREGWTTIRFSGSQIHQSPIECTQIVLNELMSRGFQPYEMSIKAFNHIYCSAQYPISTFAMPFICEDLKEALRRQIANSEATPQ